MEQPQLITVPDLYQFIDGFIETLKEPEARQNFQMAKADFENLIEQVPADLSALTSGDLALKALQLGMVAGIADGLRLATSEPWREEFEPESLPLARSWSTLWSNLNDVRATAHQSWKPMEPDDLHLLWEYGRHQNLDTLKQAFAYAGRADNLDFKVFLLATFKSGYAVSMAQALWKFTCSS